MPRISRLRPTGIATAAVALAAVLATTLTASADPSQKAVPAPPTSPTSADQIQNIDQVRTAIKGYYGNTKDATTVNPVTGTTDLYTFDPNGAYANEVTGITTDAKKWLDKSLKRYPVPSNAKRAILLDVDDTSLSTYNYEIYTNFVYNPTSNAAFVNAGVFPAVPSMPQLTQYAQSKGYTLFFLTGRPESQRSGTEENLSDAGYSFQDSNVYLKDLTKPIYSSCAPSCSTIQYKSLTRKYIESQGYDITANFGDQYSDLTGGYADRGFKLPNPMYYLP
ncbi:HAD family hydrolase [Jatrophihabitans fulvus]